MVLLIDNYDSFSYNLVQLIGELTDGNIKVVRNDEITIDEIRKLNPESIILSPGPGKPEDAGICEDVVRQLKDEYPILGVCLGHQSICEVFGAKVTYAKNKKGKKISLKWAKISKVTGYNVRYATTKKKLKKAKVKNIKTNTPKYTIKKLKKKKYYVQVRAYRTVNGKKIYGDWSKVKSVKVKK